MRRSVVWSAKHVALGLLLVVLGPGMAGRVEAGKPTWSQKLKGSKRFKLVLDGAAALDKETNLVWELAPDSESDPGDKKDWSTAQFFCNNRVVGERRGWRLPTAQELASLVDPDNPTGNPDLPPGHPFSNVQSAAYWSATSIDNVPAGAWFVDFGDAGVGLDFKANAAFVWCVRGGNGGPDAQ